MEAAEKLFADKGFAGTSVRDIAEAAGVNLAMISYYFGSKDKLMESMFRFRGEYLRLQLQNMLHNTELTSLQKIEKLIDHYIDRVFQKQSFHKVVIREQVVECAGPIADQIVRLKKGNQALFKQLVQEGQKKGEFKKGVDVPLLLMTLVGTISQLVTTQQYYRDVSN